MDGSKMRDKVGYAINKEDQAIKKRILPQKMVFSVEQSAIIGGIQSKKNKRHEIVTKTDSLNTIMAAESRTLTKNPKTQTSRKILDHEGPRITLIWVLSHKEIPGNKKADQAAKEALDEDISTTERYSQDDLKKWLTEEDFKKRDQRWKNKMIQRNKQVKHSVPSIRGPPTVSRWKGLTTHYTHSATTIYPSTAYCGNAKKLRTRQQTWT
jgi:hypothetical protein